ncbi:MAG: NADH-quinone oxidoreductase subunit M [Candidatus Thermoplasmatota archaeon]|jgi:NADH-quinone oxidoreductase subunit M|nr:NADH-quinone oxidoreductase subunit M [Candidatus Thermoplasmatota archaeon]MCL5790768.1 NADH-quinone oxidoreductase subunit M [Candidatus Thermoplasmatota archaeon]
MFILGIFLLLLLFAIISFAVREGAWKIATVESLLILVLTAIYAVLRFTSYTGGFMSVSSYPVDTSIGISFSTGVSALSMALLFLSAVVMFIAIFVSGREKFNRSFYGLMLSTEVGLFGLLISRNFLFFYVFWEAIIIPVFMLISIYGGKGKEKAALKFFVYTQIGSVFLLLSILTLFSFYGTAYHTFTLNMGKLLNTAFITQYITGPNPFWTDFLLFGFFFSFLVKMPSFPLHSWLPDAYTSAPYPVSIVLAGAISLMGGYGFFAVLLPITAVIGSGIAWAIILLGIFSLIYFALVAMFQTDMKRMMAYASAASMGFISISLGIGILSSGNVAYLAVTGGIFQILAHGLIMSLVFSSLYIIKNTTGSQSNLTVSGLFREMPIISTFLLAGVMASLGLPGLAGFIAEASIVLASYQVIGFIIFFIIFGMIITASYHVWMVQKSLNGPYNENLGKLKDGTKMEIAVLSFLFIIILVLGVYPSLFYHMIFMYVKGVF